MVFEQTVETKLSLRELVNRLHNSTEYLNRYITQYDGTSNPVQRADALTRIVRERLRLQILVKKFGKAYLDAVERNINELSNFILRNPQAYGQLESVFEQTKKNLKWVIEEESRERQKSHYLRTDAKSMVDKVTPILKSARRKVEKLQKQMAQKQRPGQQK